MDSKVFCFFGRSKFHILDSAVAIECFEFFNVLSARIVTVSLEDRSVKIYSDQEAYHTNEVLSIGSAQEIYDMNACSNSRIAGNHTESGFE